MAQLLVVHHSPTPTVQRLTAAVLAGARDDEIEGVETGQAAHRCCGGHKCDPNGDGHGRPGCPHVTGIVVGQ